MPTVAQRIEELLGQNVSLPTIQDIIQREFALNDSMSSQAIQDEWHRINPTGQADFSGLRGVDIPFRPPGGRPMPAPPAGVGTQPPAGWVEPSFPTYQGLGPGDPGSFPSSTAVPKPAGVTSAADFQAISPEFTPREILSRTRGGRGDIWSSFLENMPGSRNFSNLLRRGYQEAFNPLSAQFALQSNIPGPAGGYGPLDFRSFLKSGPQRFTQQDFMESLGPLRMAFGDDPPDTSYGLRERFEDVQMQNNLMAQIMGGNIAPGLREFLPGIIERKRSALFDVDPEANIWRQFLADPRSI